MESRRIVTGIVLAALVLSGYQPVRAEEYRIGPEDVLEISFWQEPSLNTTVRVGLDGKITLDIIGQLQAAGMTTRELEQEIVRRMSRFNQQISQAVVRVVQFNYNYVYVAGQVRQGGKMTFEAIPDLWTIINEAGGVTETGDLSRVTIIRGGKDAGKVEVVNVRAALARGELDKLPKIRRGDTIEIPRTPASVPSGDLVQTVERKDLVYAVGAVVQPGPISFEENLDILDAIAMAGGPAPDADLRRVTIVTKDGRYAQTLTVNLEEYVSSGRPGRYILRREDTFVIPRRTSPLGFGVGTVTALASVVTSLVFLLDRL